MALTFGTTYRIKSCYNTSTNRYLNVYGNEQVSNNRNVCLWTLDASANAQKWVYSNFSDNSKLVTALSSTYALNYYWLNGQGNPGNCDIYPHSNNDTDSALTIVAINASSTAQNMYRIKLKNYNLYLTAAGDYDNADVSWQAYSGTSAQTWKFEDVTNYTYPTTSRVLSQIYSNAHPGIDIASTQGTPIYAFADGIVSYTQNATRNWNPYSGDPSQADTETDNASSLSSMGNAIAINHYNPDSNVCSGSYARTIYMHMSGASNYSVGNTVHKGDVIGYIGSTGRSTGPHLHFALSVGSLSTMAPGTQGWVKISDLPNKNSVNLYLPEYHL